MISIVVPTYNEADNLRELVGRVFATLRGHGIEGELIVVDDGSPDGTGEVADRLALEFPVKVVHRAAKSGLASAVVEGFRLADGDILGVMDADLSHDPAAIPALVAAIRDRGADVAVASRYVAGGGVRNWPLVRRVVSWAANVMARPFTPIRDATSGFFFVRRSVIDGVALNPTGFKIGVEILTKGRYATWEELPYVFTDRATGTSKLSTGEVVNYLGQLVRLTVGGLRGDRPANLALWPIIGAFIAIQAAIVLFAANGPFIDEGIYTVAGIRTLEGKAAADGYNHWFNGSLYLWPILAAFGHRIAGLAGARLLALAFSVVTLTAFAGSAQNLFGRAAGWWGTVAFAANGCFMALAHFAVYDVVALAGLATSMWLGTRWVLTGSRRWLLVGACVFALAVVAKYGYILMIAPLAALLLASRPAVGRRREVGLFVIVAGVLAAAYFTAVLGKPWPTTADAYFSQSYRPTRWTLAGNQLHYALAPIILAACGALTVWRKHSKALVVTCLAAMLVWPAFHLGALNYVSDRKHAVAGFLFGYLLAGPALERVWGSRTRWAMAAVLPIVVLWGTLQSQWIEYSWSDVRPVASFLLDHMNSGESLVADWAAPYTFYLYPHKVIASPSEVFDAGSRRARPGLEACAITWLVSRSDARGPLGQAVARCGYRPVLSTTETNFYLTKRFKQIFPASLTQTLILYRLP